MKITKLGHCCLLVEEGGLRVLTDPGAYSTAQNDLTNIDLVIITHEHQDHLHIESLKIILKNNPDAHVITNSAVGKILTSENIAHEIVEDGENTTIGQLDIEGHGKDHAYIYKTVSSVQNTGYFIGRRLFYPGDALYNPPKPVEVLALPVAGPWLTVGDAIDYAKAVAPKVCFPVHDGMINFDLPVPTHRFPQKILSECNIKFVPMVEGSTEEF